MAARFRCPGRHLTMALFRTLFFIPIFYLGSVPIVLASFLSGYISAPLMHRAVLAWSRYHRFCARWILGIKVVVDGELPNKPVIYAIKHESMFETIDMPRMFGLPAVIAKQELFRIPFWGPAATRFGMMAVDREGGAAALRKMIGWGKDMQKQGRPIVIFPEGTRVRRGERPAIQSGFAGLYKLLGLPVVPIAVNSGIVCPRDSKIRYSGTMTYLVGAEIPPGLPRAEIEERVHGAINALNS